MTDLEIKQLLELTKENNVMLHRLTDYLINGHDDAKDFMMNFVANILSNNYRNK